MLLDSRREVLGLKFSFVLVIVSVVIIMCSGCRSYEFRNEGTLGADMDNQHSVSASEGVAADEVIEETERITVSESVVVHTQAQEVTTQVQEVQTQVQEVQTQVQEVQTQAPTMESVQEVVKKPASITPKKDVYTDAFLQGINDSRVGVGVCQYDVELSGYAQAKAVEMAKAGVAYPVVMDGYVVYIGQVSNLKESIVQRSGSYVASVEAKFVDASVKYVGIGYDVSADGTYFFCIFARK